MRWLIALALIGGMVGCESSAPQPAKRGFQVDEAKYAKAKARFSAFCDELAKGAELLESHPSPDKIIDEVTKLRGLLNEAADVYPEYEKMDKLAAEGTATLKFFSASLTTVKHADPKKGLSDKAKKAVDDNASAVRKRVDDMRSKLDIPTGDAIEERAKPPEEGKKKPGGSGPPTG